MTLTTIKASKFNPQRLCVVLIQGMQANQLNFTALTFEAAEPKVKTHHASGLVCLILCVRSTAIVVVD